MDDKPLTMKENDERIADALQGLWNSYGKKFHKGQAMVYLEELKNVFSYKTIAYACQRIPRQEKWFPSLFEMIKMCEGLEPRSARIREGCTLCNFVGVIYKKKKGVNETFPDAEYNFTYRCSCELGRSLSQDIPKA